MKTARIAAPQSPLQRGNIFDWLAEPYLLACAGFLFVMVALSFDIAPIQRFAMSVRWPVLGMAAFLGLLQFASRGLGKISVAHGCLFLFLLVAGGSSFYSIDSRYTFERTISIALLFTATFVGIYSYAQSLENARKLTDMLWWIGALTVIAGAIYRHGSMGPTGRYDGIHNRATGAGTFAALFVPLAIYQIRYRFRNGWQVFGWFVLCLLLGQTVLAGARMAILTSGAVALALWVQYYGAKAYSLLIAVALLVPVPFLLNPQRVEKLQEKSKRIVRAESLTTFTGRLDRWVFGIEQFMHKPFAGHGLGASRTLAGLEDPRRFNISPGEVFNLHSDQIEVLMDLGIVGFLPFGLFWIYIPVAGVGLLYQRPDPSRQLALAYGGSAFYAFVDTFMHGGFLAAGGGVSSYSWTMIAVMLALVARPAQQRWLTRRRDPSIVQEDTASSRTAPPPARTLTQLPSARQLARLQ